MKKLLDVFKKPLWLLCLGLGIVLFASIFANMANTSAYQVSVTEVVMTDIKDEDGNVVIDLQGELHGLLYRPKSCTKENPCATIVTTHGYLNSKEMQDAPAIELSKRGYVVFAMDMYDHGDSTWENEETMAEFAFFYFSQWDAVQWVAEQDYVLKVDEDDDGEWDTAMIAVSGHSMGGFSSRMAAQFDSLEMLGGGKQRIVAALPVGADFRYVASTEAGIKRMIGFDAAAKRSMGTIAAKYDEFFFQDPIGLNEDGEDKYPAETVAEKDWTETEYGTLFAEGSTATLEEVNAGEWNEDAYNGGGSVIYVPNEIHPWNHFSLETTAMQIEFYDKAFETQFDIHGVTENEGVVAYEDKGGQSWWLKEGFECIGLIGMFLAVTAAIALFAGLPFFNRTVTAEGEINAVESPTGYRKWLMRGLLVASCFATAYVYPMTGSDGDLNAYVTAVRAIMWAAALVLLAAGVVNFTIKAVKGPNETASKVIGEVVVGGVATFAAAFFSYWTLTEEFFTNTTFYSSPETNPIAYWVLLSAGLTLLALVLGYFLNNRKAGYTCANYGLKANWKQILISLLTAVIVVGGVYVLTFAIEALLKVDFRVWTYAIKPFSANHFVAFLKYLPVFFLFFLVNAISVVGNTGTDKTWKGTLKAVLIGALPLVLLLGVHYGYDFVTGVAKWPKENLHMILVWVLPITMGFAAWIARKSYVKTGNIWTGVFINAILFTLIQVANTTLYLF